MLESQERSGKKTSDQIFDVKLHKITSEIVPCPVGGSFFEKGLGVLNSMAVLYTHMKKSVMNKSSVFDGPNFYVGIGTVST